MSSNQQQIQSQQGKQDYDSNSRRLRYLWFVLFTGFGLVGIVILALYFFPAEPARFGYYLLLSLGFIGLVFSTLVILRASDNRKKKLMDE